MSTRSSWGAASSYLEKNVANRLQEEAFKVDYSTQQCVLQCADGYWSDSTPADIFLHKCVSNNCKSWAATDTADACDACWDNADLSAADWPGKAAYSDQKLAGRHPVTPFNLVSQKCELACDTDYWPSYTTGIVTPLDVYDQRCTSKNCMTWNSEELFWAHIHSELQTSDAEAYPITHAFTDTWAGTESAQPVTDEFTKIQIQQDTKKITKSGSHKFPASYAGLEYIISEDGTFFARIASRRLYYSGHVEAEGASYNTLVYKLTNRCTEYEDAAKCAASAEWEVKKALGQQLAPVSPATTAIWVDKTADIVYGCIENSAAASLKEHHMFYGITRVGANIKGVFIGDGANNSGVFVAKRKPAGLDELVFNDAVIDIPIADQTMGPGDAFTIKESSVSYIEIQQIVLHPGNNACTDFLTASCRYVKMRGLRFSSAPLYEPVTIFVMTDGKLYV